MSSYLVATPQGPGRWHLNQADDQRALLLLGHGAGGGVSAPDLELLARRLPEHGVTVLRFEQPWRVAGRRIAVRPAQLDEAWISAVQSVTGRDWAAGPLFFGGRSAGARVACRTAARFSEPGCGVRGIVCLAFPLHLPGQPAKSRAGELLGAVVPRLVLQGSRDSFGSAAEVRQAAGADPGVHVVELAGADHSYRLAKAAAGAAAHLRAQIFDQTLDFVRRLAGIATQ